MRRIQNAALGICLSRAKGMYETGHRAELCSRLIVNRICVSEGSGGWSIKQDEVFQVMQLVYSEGARVRHLVTRAGCIQFHGNGGVVVHERLHKMEQPGRVRRIADLCILRNTT